MNTTTTTKHASPYRTSGASKAYALVSIVVIATIVVWKVSSDPHHGIGHIGASITLGALALLLLHSTAWQTLTNRKPINPNSTIYAILCVVVALLISH